MANAAEPWYFHNNKCTCAQGVTLSRITAFTLTLRKILDVPSLNNSINTNNTDHTSRWMPHRPCLCLLFQQFRRNFPRFPRGRGSVRAWRSWLCVTSQHGYLRTIPPVKNYYYYYFYLLNRYLMVCQPLCSVDNALSQRFLRIPLRWIIISHDNHVCLCVDRVACRKLEWLFTLKITSRFILVLE